MSINATKSAFVLFADERLDRFNLCPVERMTLSFLCHRHNAKTGECFPCMATIARSVGVSEGRARKAVRKLESLGLIATKRRSGQAGNSSNQYELLFMSAGQTAGILQGETSRRLSVSDRHTSIDDRVITLKGGLEVPHAKGKRE